MEVYIIAAMSIDGFIASSENQNSMDWTSKEDKKLFVKMTKESGVMVTGRKTFETYGKPLPGRRNIVLSRTMPAIEGIEIWSSSSSSIINRLKEEGCGSVAICGGAHVYSEFLNSGLVTKLEITIEPVILGEGVRLFKNEMPSREFCLKKIEQLNSKGTLHLSYELA